MERLGVFTEEHQAFRRTVRDFLEHELAPNARAFEEQGHATREFFRKAGALGMIAPFIEEKYGGAGGDFLHYITLTEELGRCPQGSVIGPAPEYGSEPKFWM